MIPEDTPTQEQVTRYAYLSPMLDSALSELREFAKRKQDGIVSTAKIKLLNRLLVDIREIVGKEKSIGYLDLLNEEDLPQNSDAVMVLGQYRAALNSFHTRHHRWAQGEKRWVTVEFLGEFETEGMEDEDDGDEDPDDGGMEDEEGDEGGEEERRPKRRRK